MRASLEPPSTACLLPASCLPPACRLAASEQYERYVNRFGPGLVIYWHGFIADLDKANAVLLLLLRLVPCSAQLRCVLMFACLTDGACRAPQAFTHILPPPPPIVPHAGG